MGWASWGGRGLQSPLITGINGAKWRSGCHGEEKQMWGQEQEAGGFLQEEAGGELRGSGICTADMSKHLVLL